MKVILKTSCKSLLPLLILCCALTRAGGQNAVVPPELFDRFGDIHYGDAGARLDALAYKLNNDQTAVAHIIVYPGQQSYPGVAHRYANRFRNYLVSHWNELASRIRAVDGGWREDLTVEIWVSHGVENPPVPAPTHSAPPRPQGAYVFDEYPLRQRNDEDFDDWDGRHEDPEARLGAFASFLKANPDVRAYLIAESQALYFGKPIGRGVDGKMRYAQIRNRRLSDRRGTDSRIARAERRYLIKYGIEPGRIVAVGNGYGSVPKVGVDYDPRGGIYSGRQVALWVVPKGTRPPALRSRSTKSH